MNILSFLLICALAFLGGIILGFLKGPKFSGTKQPTNFKQPPIAYEISENLNSEYRNFLSYDGSEQN